MELFVLNDQLAKLQQDLLSAQGLARVYLLTEVAWHLRERDSRQALSLADEIMLLAAEYPQAQRGLHARALLVRGEALRLFAELELAEQSAKQSQSAFMAEGDLLGYSDACSLLAWIAMDRGEAQQRDMQLEMAASLALQASDKLRADVATLTQARAAVFRDVQYAMERWGPHYAAVEEGRHPGLAACVHDFLATAAGQCSDFARAIEYWIHSHEASLLSGQLRRAAVTATNIGNSFNSLNEHNTALEWMQRALDLARPTEWPGTVGGCLMQTGETLRRLGRIEPAYDILFEAQQTLIKLPNSRNYAITLEYLGDLMLDRHDYQAACAIFDEQQERADTLGQVDFQISAHRGKAHALSCMDQPQDALQEAQTALALAQQHNDAWNQILILRVLAKIHVMHDLPHPQEMDAPNPVLHYLLQAIAVAKGIEAYTVPSDLYDALGREYAQIGDFALAYAMSLQAIASREKTHSEGATNRAIAMQVRHQTERAQADGEHHRQLAAEQARRAEILLQTSSTLERLSSIGQEITTHLDAAAVFQTLHRHLHGLLDANSLSVFLLEGDGQHLRLAFGNENGRPLPEILVPLDHPYANSVRCLREKREILIDVDQPEMEHTTFMPGTDHNRSMLYGLLAVSDHVIGVMSVQSQRAYAFGERERQIFRSLCAYGAIAFDNSATYLQLKATLQTLSETQVQLAHTAKAQMAAEQLARQKAEEATQMKSAFLANMSHEIRTPMNAVIGLAHLALRTQLTPKQQDYLNKIQRAGISLLGIINDILDFSKIEAGKLDIEQVAFSLDDVLANVASVSSQKAADKGLEYLFRIAPAVPRHLHGDPLRLGQVLINLVNNAIKFTEHGEIELACELQQQDEGRVLLAFAVRDTGIGMSEAQVAQLFQPFTQADGSTSRKFGGTGLGLSISQHLVQLMGASLGHVSQIVVESKTGVGSRFGFTLAFTRAEDISDSRSLPPVLEQARLAVVDDNPVALEIFVEALQGLPLRVDAFSNAHSALQAIVQAQAEQDPYALVISDWQMAGMDGIQLARALRAEATLLPAPQFILATAFGREETQELAEEAGIAGFLYKPVSQTLLLSTLHSVFSPHSKMVVQSNLPQYNFGRARVLLAEDNEINQQIAYELLSAVNVSVSVAENGLQVLQILRNEPEDSFPVLLMDLEMPELDGHATTAQIRKDARYDHLAIIAMTAHAMPEIRERCLQAGMQEYLTKPIQPEQLYATLARWLHPHRPPLQHAAPGKPLPASHHNGDSEFTPGNTVGSGSLAGQAALEQLLALLQFNPQAALDYFVSIESGLALLLDAAGLQQLEIMLHRHEYEELSQHLENLIKDWRDGGK